MNTLPPYVQACVDALENAGYEAYAVGGCVRDDALGLIPEDFDLCTSALPEETEAVFAGNPLVLAGKKHGTVAVITPEGLVEITTYRTEGDYGDNRHPDWVKFVRNIHEDLSRRDFTVNAMAYSPYRGYADPFGGRRDLERKLLRAVGDPVQRFQEDSLRILRGIRFAVKYGLQVEPETERAMHSQAHLMDNLARERVYAELCKLLPLLTAADCVRFAPVLAQVMPELGAEIGFDQRSPHHAYDLITHTANVVENVPGDPALRWAALLHDIGKVPTFTQDETGRGHFYGHAPKGGQMADDLLRRLKAPNALREEVVTLITHHMTKIPPTAKGMRRWLSRLGWDTTRKLLFLQEADMRSKGVDNTQELTQFAPLWDLLEQIRQENACLSLKDLAVNGRDLMALGIQGKALGQTLNALLDAVLDEAVPNEKEALLEYSKKL